MTGLDAIVKVAKRNGDVFPRGAGHTPLPQVEQAHFGHDGLQNQQPLCEGVLDDDADVVEMGGCNKGRGSRQRQVGGTDEPTPDFDVKTIGVKEKFAGQPFLHRKGGN